MYLLFDFNNVVYVHLEKYLYIFLYEPHQVGLGMLCTIYIFMNFLAKF